MSRTAPNTASYRLQAEAAASRIHFTWLGLRRTLTVAQKEEAASCFGAEGKALSATKILLNTQNKDYMRLSAFRSQIRNFWHASTLPWPEPGIRLLRRPQVAMFNEQMERFRSEMLDAATRLDAVYPEIKEEARRRLGNLFNSADYPATLHGMFDVTWDFPNLDVPEYLERLDSALYEEEKRRVQAQFECAIRLAEQAFAEELRAMLAHLAERLEDNADGSPKVWRDSAILKVRKWFETFKVMDCGSNAALAAVVQQAEGVFSAATPTDLRGHSAQKAAFRQEAARLESVLAENIIDGPRRRIRYEPESPILREEGVAS